MITRELINALIQHESQIEDFVLQLSSDIVKAARVFVAGNGGSAAIASHMVTDIMKTTMRFDLPSVICLSDSIPLLTALANDVAYDQCLSEAANLHHVGTGDLVVLISSSGNSSNVLNLARMAKYRNATVVGMTGFGGGILPSLSSRSLVIDVNDYGVVEDIHHHVIHCLVRALR